MFLAVKEEKLRYEMENLCRLFYPFEDIKVTDSLPEDCGEKYALVEISFSGKLYNVRALAVDGSRSEREVREVLEGSDIKSLELAAADCLYCALVKLCGFESAWGMLTGVRPSKLMRTLIGESSEERAVDYFLNTLYVSPEKTELAVKIATVQRESIALSAGNSFSLYVSIPFCPARCSYCSFVSHSISGAKKLIEPYVELLCAEIRQTAEIAKELNLRLETVYFGGGTPTVLTPEQLYKITNAVNSGFDIPSVREYTVEAGRPDTLTREKLEILKNAGVSRISINPQSFDDDVLKNIGRGHTAAQALEAFALARELGFDNINMDFIAGLPGESSEGFCAGIKKALELSPENITVHTLAMKRAAELVTEKKQGTAAHNAASMLDKSGEMLYYSGYYPYYMYRQSRILANLENTGWARGGADAQKYACLYNIYMMEEIHTVLAVGAGAVTKLKAPNSPYIERIFNFKYPYEYIDRFTDVKKRKEKVGMFYGEYQ